MLHTKFQDNPSTVRKKKIFDAFLTIYGRGSQFRRVTNIMLMEFHFLVVESLHINFGK